jgi:hypothetical protein
MKRKILSIMGVILVLFAIQSCSSSPEKSLLSKYFNALMLRDSVTLSTMALEPVDIAVDSWEIVTIGEESVEPATLPDLNKKELDLKKAVEDSVGTTLDARDTWDDAVYEEENARTRAARRAAKVKADDLKVKYDEILEQHRNLQREYNEAKAAAAKEEEISVFSLGYKADDVPLVRDFTGDVHFKEVDIKIVSEGETKNYKVYMRKYMLKNEASGRSYRGRWVILRFELI